ncbi:MAG: hypothetical protein ACE5LS_02565 [Thermoplasmata archaeon]
MTTTEENWKLFIIAAITAGVIGGATWLGVAILTSFGFTGVLGAILIFTLILAVLGVFAIIGLFWLIFSVLRVGDSLEEREERPP